MEATKAGRGTVSVNDVNQAQRALWEIRDAHRKAQAAARLAKEADEGSADLSLGEAATIGELIKDIHSTVCVYNRADDDPLNFMSKDAFYLSAAVNVIAEGACKLAVGDDGAEFAMGLTHLLPQLVKDLARAEALAEAAMPKVKAKPRRVAAQPAAKKAA